MFEGTLLYFVHYFLYQFSVFDIVISKIYFIPYNRIFNIDNVFSLYNYFNAQKGQILREIPRFFLPIICFCSSNFQNYLLKNWILITCFLYTNNLNNYLVIFIIDNAREEQTIEEDAPRCLNDAILHSLWYTFLLLGSTMNLIKLI